MIRTPSPARLSWGERLDSAIFSVFPGWGANRMAARMQAGHQRNVQRLLQTQVDRLHSKQLSRQNEAADNDRIRGGRWIGSRLSPDSGAEQDLETLQKRVEDLYRNEGYAKSYVEGRVDNEVGCGITPQARILAPPAGGPLTRERADEHNREIESLYERWQPTAGRRGEAFWTIQRMTDRDLARFGEAFVLLTDQAPAEHSPIPLVLEVIYPGRIVTPPQKFNDPLCRLGVQRDKDERILGYWVRTWDPGDTLGDGGTTYKFVPAHKPGQSGWSMIHVFEPQFAGQTRGLPDLAPVMNLIKDLKDVQEATIIAMQIEACCVAFIATTGNTPAGAAAANSSGIDASGNRMEDMRPGQVHYGNPGEKPEFLSPQRPGSSFGAFVEWTLRAIGAGVGYCYNLLARDWSKVNYSSGRLALIDARKSFACRRKLLVERLCQPVWTRLCDEGLLAGVLTFDPTDYVREPWRYQRCQWVGDRQEWVDPSSEVGAATDAIAAGLDSRTNNVMSRGMDPEDLQRQLEREDEQDIARRKRKQELEKEAGLTPSEGAPEAPAAGPPAAS